MHNRINKMSFILVFVSITALLVNSVNATEVERFYPPPKADITGIYIWNASNTDLNFQLGYEGRNWKWFKLKSDESGWYRHNGNRRDLVNISLKTSNKSVLYRLLDSGRHKLMWNSKKRLWDVFGIRPS